MNANAIINIARVQLGLEDDDYRALLLRVTGKDSLRTRSECQKIAILDEMKRLGFRVRAGGRALAPSHKPYIRLIHALWKNCARLGVIENGSREALRAFAHRFVAHGDASVAVILKSSQIHEQSHQIYLDNLSFRCFYYLLI